MFWPPSGSPCRWTDIVPVLAGFSAWDVPSTRRDKHCIIDNSRLSCAADDDIFGVDLIHGRGAPRVRAVELLWCCPSWRRGARIKVDPVGLAIRVSMPALCDACERRCDGLDRGERVSNIDDSRASCTWIQMSVGVRRGAEAVPVESVRWASRILAFHVSVGNASGFAGVTQNLGDHRRAEVFLTRGRLSLRQL